MLRALLRRLLAVCLLLPSCLCGVHALAAEPAGPLILGGAADPATYANRWSKLVFQEAFRRLGVAVQIVNYPLARRTMMMDAGEIDIDGGRVHAYGEAHPNLVRVEEPFVEYSFGLYTANPVLRLHSLDDMRKSNWQVEYRRGILFCETILKPLLPVDRLSDISNEEQGINKLLAGRTDLYCDLDYPVRDVLSAPGFTGAARIRRVLGLGTIPIYLYMQRKHAELALRLAETFKKMKAEGLIEAYQARVADEMGRPR